jgi:uncharacterized membrane protein YhaH (DUF805 family)
MERMGRRTFWFWQLAFNVIAVVTILVLVVVLLRCQSDF